MVLLRVKVVVVTVRVVDLQAVVHRVVEDNHDQVGS